MLALGTVSGVGLLVALAMVASQAVQRGKSLRQDTANATALGFHCRTLRSDRERQDCLAQAPPQLP